MNRTHRWLLAVFFALGALVAPTLSMALDTKDILDGVIWDEYHSSFTSVTSKTVDIAGYGSTGYSTSPVNNVYLFSYTIIPIGSSATYTVTQTTKTPSNAAYYGVYSSTGFNSPAPWSYYSLTASTVTSSAITIPAGVGYSADCKALTVNPVFTFTNLSSAATYYITAEIGRPKR